MTTTRFFDLQQTEDTLVVVTLREITSLDDEDLDAELSGVEHRLDQPDVKNLVVDLGDVSYLESCTLNTIVSLWKRVRNRNGKMALCNVSELAREILQVANLDSVWPVLDSRDEALSTVRS